MPVSRLDRRIQAVDLDGLLDDLVPAHDQPIAGEDLIIRRDLASLLNGLEVDLVHLGWPAAAPGPDKTDILWLGGAASEPPAKFKASSTVSFPV